MKITSTIPLIALILFSLSFIAQRKFSLRESILMSASTLGVAVVAITELLSYFQALNTNMMVLSWLIVALVPFLYLINFKSERNESIKLSSYSVEINALDKFMLALVLAIVSTTLIIALISPPNTWDSMTYHMARVAHWIQNESVNFYPTHILRQLYQSPWSEYAITNLQLLSGGDDLANLVQWFAMTGSLIGASLVSKEFGLNKSGQILTALICATIPMGILQSTSTQNDYIESFWVLCLALFLIRYLKTERITYLMIASLVLGLAYLTKPVSIFYFSPLVFFIGLMVFKKASNKFYRYCIILVAIPLFLNLGHLYRNYSLFDSPFGPTAEGDYAYKNKRLDLAEVSSNIIRNSALHIGSSEKVNYFFEKNISYFHKIIGISENDPRTTWTGTTFKLNIFSNHEDVAGNPIHILLIAISMIWLFLTLTKIERPYFVYLYATSCVVGYFLFCIAIVWMPWNTRLHLPFFVLASPIIAILLTSRGARFIAPTATVIVLIFSLPSLFLNNSRPLLGESSILETSRDSNYFSNRPKLIRSFTDVKSILNNVKCDHIGLLYGGDDWEYPLFTMLVGKNRKELIIQHIDVLNISNKIMEVKNKPCAILSTHKPSVDSYHYQNKNYIRVFNDDLFTLFLP